MVGPLFNMHRRVQNLYLTHIVLEGGERFVEASKCWRVGEGCSPQSLLSTTKEKSSAEASWPREREIVEVEEEEEGKDEEEEDGGGRDNDEETWWPQEAGLGVE